MIAGLVLFALGALFLWRVWRTRQKLMASMSWPYTPGRIIGATVRQEVTRGDADTADQVTYQPVVQYEYQVSGQLYQGNRFALQDKAYSSSKKAFDAASPFQPGTPVWVFYDPAKPQDSVLERKAHGNNLGMAIGALLVVAAVVVLFRS
jgi:hypothetical protein